MESLAYFYEIGNLLDKSHKDFESYNKAWNPNYGYFNMRWGVVKRTDKNLLELQAKLKDIINESKEDTYAVIEEAGEVPYDDESDWEDTRDLCAKYDIQASEKMEDVVWSIAKIDGKIVENFLNK